MLPLSNPLHEISVGVALEIETVVGGAVSVTLEVAEHKFTSVTVTV